MSDDDWTEDIALWGEDDAPAEIVKEVATSVGDEEVETISEPVQTEETAELNYQFWQLDKVPTIVGFECGLTIRTGEFENAKPRVSIRVPADSDKLEQAYKFAVDFVDEHLSKMREQIESAIDA